MSATKIEPGLYWGWWNAKSRPVLVQFGDDGLGTRYVICVLAGLWPMTSSSRDPDRPADWHHLQLIENPGRLTK